jgi:hypothetical protein
MIVTGAEHITADGLASRYHKSKWWVYANYEKLNIPVLRVGRELLFPVSELLDWEAKHRN